MVGQGLQTHRFQLDQAEIERRLRYVGLESADIERMATIRETVIANVDKHVAVFFDTLSGLDEAATLFRSRELLDEAKRLKREHLIALVGGDYGAAYVDERIRLGALYSRAGLEVRVFLGAFHHLMRAIGKDIMQRSPDNPERAFDAFMSLKKVGFFDIGIIVDVLVAERERTINLQQEAIRELSSPVLQVRDRLLILPLIGMIDSDRAMQITDSLLKAIRANRAKLVVIDITGVAAVDSKVANHLLQTVAASQLMGAKVIVTGLSADVAQALVALGVDLSKVNTVGDLQGGLEEAERILGLKVVPIEALPKSDRL
jgi:rsbT co-antagonist protein RsbR